jgi:hypothetical protein
MASQVNPVGALPTGYSDAARAEAIGTGKVPRTTGNNTAATSTAEP